MKKLLAYLQLSFIALSGNSQSVSHWLEKLDSAIQQSGVFDSKKVYRIDELRQKEQNHSVPELYNLYLSLFDEFSTFNSDSAYSYAKKLDSSAFLLQDSSRI